MKKIAVIVAGGKGVRFGANLPKQFLLLQGKPILQHTIEAFDGITDDVIVVLPHDQQEAWENLIKDYNIKVKHTVVTGGNTRFQSVYNALQTITGDALVAIHDGVRPLVSEKLIATCFNAASIYGSAVTYITLKDSIREMVGENSKAVDRNSYRLIQTPQVFHANELKQAYQVQEHDGFTDDASVMEAAGYKINLVEGEQTNIKVTLPLDLKLAETLLGK